MNKKRFIITAILIMALLLVGCSNKEGQQPAQNSNDKETAADSGPAAGSSGSACDNIFYPLALDNQWVYNLDMYQDNPENQSTQSSSSDMAFTVSEAGDSSAVLGALDYDSGVVTQTTVQCQDQAIVNFPITELNMVFGDFAGDIQVDYVSGIFMPSESEFEANGWDLEWETEYKASGNIDASFEGESLSAVLAESPVRMRWQVVSQGDSMEVPAGTFNDLVKINREISFEISSLTTYIEGSEMSLATTLSIVSNLWYAPHIGLIKQEVNSASIEVYGMNFPIEAWGYTELSSYTIN